VIRLPISLLLFSVFAPNLIQAQGPVFVITPEVSTVQFSVKASVAIVGKFDKWDATLTFPSADVTSGVLDIKIYADSVNTGSGTFKSNKLTQTGPTTFDVAGTFTIRGVSKPETLNLEVSGKGMGSGEIKGTMAFDRKEFGMNSAIPFIKIADRVEVTVALKGKRVSGPPLVFKQ